MKNFGKQTVIALKKGQMALRVTHHFMEFEVALRDRDSQACACWNCTASYNI